MEVDVEKFQIPHAIDLAEAWRQNPVHLIEAYVECLEVLAPDRIETELVSMLDDLPEVTNMDDRKLFKSQ